MDEEISAKDVQIQMLLMQLKEAKNEILRQRCCLDDVKYFATVGRDAVLAAAKGEAKKPILRLAEGYEST